MPSHPTMIKAWYMSSNEDWDEYFTPTKREMRRERRAASNADRSQYKKTDQEKLIDRSLQLDTKKNESTLTGRILLIRSQDVLVFSGNQSYVCSLKGTLKQSHSKKKNLVVVGDIVDFTITSLGCGIIEKIHQRSSFLCRQDHLDRIKQQLLAANIDQLIIVVSVSEPAFSNSLIDRYLIAARKGSMTPVIVINKWDLCKDYPNEAAQAENCLNLYRSLGINAINISVQTGENLDALKSALQNKVSVFSGPSGTGKTRLLNCLTGKTLTIGPIRAMGKGSHTTSCAQLIPLPFGGWTVDTPGIRSLGIFELTKEDLHDEFAEIFSQPCEFTGCAHTQNDTSCSVQKALEDGSVSAYRYASYLSLLKSLKAPRKRR
jgi:ribosome biogenesis GTPase / thiamine phosphate phosphatase